MEAEFDFLKYALPLVAIGFLLAFFAVRSAGRKKNGNDKDDFNTEGMCIGMCLGTAIGIAIDNNPGIGLSIGLAFGLLIWSNIKKEKNDEKKK